MSAFEPVNALDLPALVEADPDRVFRTEDGDTITSAFLSTAADVVFYDVVDHHDRNKTFWLAVDRVLYVEEV